MKTPTRSTLIAAVTLVWATTAAAQGLYWESTTTGIGHEPRMSKMYAMPKMLKIVHPDGKVMIIRSDQDKFYSVDPTRQTYREIGKAELETTSKALQDQMQKLRERMKDLSPEQRAMMEKMMPPQPGEAAKPVVVKDTGETKSINGLTCRKYVAIQDGKTVLIAWTTNEVKGFAPLRDDWLSYQRRLTSTNPMLGSTVTEAYAKIDGFPMETDMGEVKTVVTKVESRRTPASEFEVPAGYKKEALNLPKPPPQ